MTCSEKREGGREIEEGERERWRERGDEGRERRHATEEKSDMLPHTTAPLELRILGVVKEGL
jgi:hypothetical protein